MNPIDHANLIFQAASPIIRILGLGGRHWCRNDAKAAKRTGPWLSANYEVLDRVTWEARSPSIYFIAGDDNIIRYTGISRNRVKDRWRECPAIDAETRMLRPNKELHHSQCWQHVEREYLAKPSSVFEVRCITATRLLPVLHKIGPPVSGFAPLAGDHEGLISAVERWLCNNKSASLVPWNVSMTYRQNAA